jgi:hypothetical protein
LIDLFAQQPEWMRHVSAVRQWLDFAPAKTAGANGSRKTYFESSGGNLVITENEITFLTLPPLPNTLGIWGTGFAVASLGVLPILRDARIFNWGDLDVHGFTILAALRDRATKTRALVMARATWEEFRSYAVNGKPSRIGARESSTGTGAYQSPVGLRTNPRSTGIGCVDVLLLEHDRGAAQPAA